jgi:murein DD-endopeptidase MepM/ murein hydrolase activator NlpD
MAEPDPQHPSSNGRQSPARPTATSSARAITYSVVALLAAVAVRRTPPRPVPAPRPATVLVRQPVTAAAPAGRADAVGGAGPAPATTVSTGPTTDTVLVTGTVRTSLAAAFADAASDVPRGKRTELAYAVADIFEYRVDMSRDLQPGDRVRVLVERSRGALGGTTLGPVLAARLEVGGNPVSAIRYESRTAGGDYFDGEGRSLRAHFLRAPLAFRRISSAFGRRRHPILGVWRQHRGLDYAAAMGTPVRAIGDGVVIRAGRAGGYGNVLEIRLRNGYVTRYGHLRNFARGLRPGARVAVGQTVAFVGTTGLSTAPHLHFEMLLGGRNRDPRLALKALKGGEPLAGRERAAFETARARLFASLDPAATGAVASSSAIAED